MKSFKKDSMKKFLYALVMVLPLLIACNAPKGTTTDKTSTADKTPAALQPPQPSTPDAKTVTLDTVTAMEGHADDVSGINDLVDTIPIYRATAKLDNDIIHTKLDVRFDWTKQHVLGKAWITAKPYFYAMDKMELDAKGFDIKKVSLENGTALTYTYAEDKLTINLGKKYTRNDKYTVYIEYTAKPNEAPEGGSEAITSDKGLFFINPDGSEDKPKQIWTQGETESNSKWFPTFDKPNEKMTSEIYMTVEDKYKTLSNGLMKSSKKNSDGTRTDHWLMDMPQPPYLVMMTVGEFEIETEKWNGKDIMYYVEPKYKGKGKTIFKYVPEILTFFSNKLGVQYPWQKLAHVAVRDYVSGAMENTTAIIYGEFMNGTERELIDKDYNEIVVAHEMFHHWFGDLVTAESWSNLTVNESFADYSESLWLEHKYGRDAADHHRREVMDGYFGQAEQRMHPLVDFHYNNREDMFDAHSYNKGGSILHMLRTYMGDEAFFEGLKKYLNENAFKTGESHQLRLALEEVGGEDLSWFFNQWYHKSGHPELDITYEYDEANKKMNVTVLQKQESKDDVPYVYELPVAIDIYQAAGQAPTRHNIRTTKRAQTFTFDVASKPALVDFDGERMLLAAKKDNHNDEEWAFMYANAPRYLARMEALEAIRTSKNPKAQPTVKAALSDKFWGVRETAVQAVMYKEDPSVLDKIATIAANDTRSTVRSAAISKLASTKDAKWVSAYRSVLEKEPAYPVISSAMQALYKVDPKAALETAKKFENDDNSDLVSGVGAIYAENAQADQIPFFEKSITKVDGMSAINFVGNYIKVLEKTNDAGIIEKLSKLRDIGINQSQSPYKRFACAKAIYDLSKKYKTQGNTKHEELTKLLSEIVSKETNEQLKAVYAQMMGG
jgi:aminopeptidase N